MKYDPKNYVAKTDSTYVAPIRFTKTPKLIGSQSSSERQYVPGHEFINEKGKIEYVKPSIRPNLSAGFLSNADPIAEFIVGNTVLGKPTQYLLDKGLKTVIGKTSGELINQTANTVKREIGSGINTIKKVPTNYKDLKNLNDFAFKYQYKPTKANIFQSKKIDDAYKSILDQHNTFVRGVSTSDKFLSKPEIVNQLIKNKIYDPKIDASVPKEKIAEYMSTHIPGNTGSGRAGLEEGLENALYVSNSLDTAKGYTYGDGYIATVKRPVDYSSSSRKDWLKSGDFSIDRVFKKEKDLLRDNLHRKLNNNHNRYFNLERNIKNRYQDKYGSNKFFNDYKNIINNSKLSEEINYANKKWDEINYNNNELKSLLANKKNTLDNNLKNNYENYIKNNASNKIEFGMPETPLTKKIFSRGLGEKLTQINGNPYQHFILNGTPGEKVVDLVKLEPFSSGIDDYTRAHTGLWSEGLSRKSYKNGGLIDK